MDHLLSNLFPLKENYSSFILKNWKRFCTWIQSNEEEGTTPKREDVFGDLPRSLPLIPDCRGPFRGPLHFLQVENNSCSRIITHDTKKVRCTN